jgi:hypothetical protein
MDRNRNVSASEPFPGQCPRFRQARDGSVTGRLLTRRTLASLLATAAAPAAATPALPKPDQAPILTVSGRIGVFNEGDAAQFDRQMLEAIGMTSFTTNTPWYDGPVAFEGVLMTRLMQVVDARGDNVTAVALNDYVTEIPMSDFGRYGVILALKRNGLYMPVRDKGPLFIVYPYDSDPELNHRRYYSRSAWQVARLIVG